MPGMEIKTSIVNRNEPAGAGKAISASGFKFVIGICTPGVLIPVLGGQTVFLSSVYLTGAGLTGAAGAGASLGLSASLSAILSAFDSAASGRACELFGVSDWATAIVAVSNGSTKIARKRNAGFG